MKLFEFSVLVTVNTVIAANSLEEAESHMKSLSSKVLVSGGGDIGEVCDIDLSNERDPKGNNLSDEAHFIVQ
jgi:hypothetical protein